jgi:hypothetical protein
MLLLVGFWSPPYAHLKRHSSVVLNVGINLQVLDVFTKEFTHVLVDEFQDVTAIQFALLQRIAPHRRITVVGDDDQVTWPSMIHMFQAIAFIHALPFESSLAFLFSKCHIGYLWLAP